MYRPILIAAVLSLTACATPQERCISNATAGLAELDAEIAEAEANIARGYRIADPVIDTVSAEYCTTTGGAKICIAGNKDIEGAHVPINVSDERARLNSLLRQRERAESRAAAEIEACQALG